MTPASHTLLFKKSQFVTRLPVHYVYLRSHFWAEQRPGSRWRLGFTKFGTRLLGEIVDYNFEIVAGAAVTRGQVLGWIEGFKGISDIICVGQGSFAGVNQALQESPELIGDDPYLEGWLYEMDGQLEDQTLDVQAYADHLNVTIDRLLQKQNEDDQRTQSSESGSL